MTFRPITEFRWTAKDPELEWTACENCRHGEHHLCQREVTIPEPSRWAGTHRCACFFCRCAK